LSHGTAAALWGLPGSSGGAIHVTVPRKSTSSKPIRRHFSLVAAEERGIEEGIPATSVHRTIFDLAAMVSLDAVVAMTKQAGAALRSLPAPAQPPLATLQRPDRARRQALCGRLPLAAPAPDRRARRLEGHSSRSAFQDDRLRDRVLDVAGFSVIHLTWNQLEVEPEDVASDLRSALGPYRPPR
jgi:hypothetical protein